MYKYVYIYIYIYTCGSWHVGYQEGFRWPYNSQGHYSYNYPRTIDMVYDNGTYHAYAMMSL